jgi:hypothetical protein
MSAKALFKITTTVRKPMPQVTCRSVGSQISQELNQFCLQVGSTMQQKMNPSPRLAVVPTFQ